MDISTLSIKELEELILAAKREIELRNTRSHRIRSDMERIAKQSGLTAEEAEFLFGQKAG